MSLPTSTIIKNQNDTNPKDISLIVEDANKAVAKAKSYGSDAYKFIPKDPESREVSKKLMKGLIQKMNC